VTLFYYGLETSGTDKLLNGGHIERACISAAILWNRKRGRFRKWRPGRIDHLGVDCGGFHSAVRKWGFPFRPEDLALLAEALGAEWVATMDFPCEPEVTRQAGETNLDRVRATVANAGACLAIRGPRWLPVVQGMAVGEYLECVRQLESAGAVRDYMAVGSLCVRKSRRGTAAVLRAVRRVLPDARLHGFGVDLRLLRDREIRHLLYSADSQAWHFAPSGMLPKGRRYVADDAEKVAAFADYRRRVEAALREPATTLDRWTGPDPVPATRPGE